MSSDHPSSSLAREIAIEQAHVDKVYARLDVATADARRAARMGGSHYTSDRGDYLREEDMTSVYERDVFAYQAAKRLATLEAEHEGLVFGRLDLTNGDTDYIGRIGVHDEDYEPLVIDWRARAAEPFYRATAAEPMDVIRRRVLHSRDQQVVGIEDDLLDDSAASPQLPVIGEGALMAALSRARGPRMRDIVATIQGEQDEAIRAPYQGVTIISGGPGTGKTVVALHRAAYLLYTHRRRFEQGGVLVVGPSDVFMAYIERVLPSLGEDSVALRSIGALPGDVIDVEATRTDPSATAVTKGSARMAEVLSRLVQVPATVLDEHAELSQDDLLVTIKGNALRIPATTLLRVRRHTVRTGRTNHARGAAIDALTQRLWDAMPEGHDMEREVFDALVAEHPRFVETVRRWWPTQRATTELARLADPAVLARVADGLLDEEEQQAIRASYAHLSASDAHPSSTTTRAGRRADWTVADAALLDELVAVLGTPLQDPEEEASLFLTSGAPVEEIITVADRLARQQDEDPYADAFTTYAHVLVDEAQDITPMQWRMLRRRGPQASWTVVGDPAQSSWPDHEELEREIEAIVGKGQLRTFRMSTNYRSPAEVFDLAARFIQRDFPQADLPTAVRSTGIEPMLLESTPEGLGEVLGRTLAELADRVEGTIGVISPPSRQEATAALVSGADLAEPLADRVVCVNTLQAKGLEYDAVVVVDPDRIIAEHVGGARILYVALTRPTQLLVTIDVTEGGQARPGGWRSHL